MKRLNEEMIEQFIADDKIIWVKKDRGSHDFLQGKFVLSDKLGDDNQKMYSFCPYKKGASYEFFTADQWLWDDQRKDDMDTLLAAALVKKKRR